MPSDFLTLVTSLAAGVAVLAAFLPKLFKSVKRDNLDSSVASAQHTMVDSLQESHGMQIAALDARIKMLDAHLARTDAVVHRQRVKLTRLQVGLIHLQGLLTSNGIEIPPHIKAEIDALVNDDVVPAQPSV